MIDYNERTENGSMWKYHSMELTNSRGFHPRLVFIAYFLLGECPGNVGVGKSESLTDDPASCDYVGTDSIGKMVLIGAGEGDCLHIRYDRQGPEISRAIQVLGDIIRKNDLCSGLEEALKKYDEKHGKK